jgi:hypothetical protein
MKKPIERDHLKYVLGKLDWIKILGTAIKYRPTSWAEHPVIEYRNAGDCMWSAVVKELEDKKVIPTHEQELRELMKELKKEGL